MLVYAVTSCDDEFTPTFEAPGGALRVTLNRSRFDEVIREPIGFPPISQYFPSGATANSFFFDMMYGGNPLNYKSFAWGVNDSCEDFFAKYDTLRSLVTVSREQWGYNGQTNRAPPNVRRFRRDAKVNTYAETAPLALIDLARTRFHIGVDRILVRTLWDQAS